MSSKPSGSGVEETTRPIVLGAPPIVTTGGSKVMTFAWGVPARSGPASARCPESSKTRAWRGPESAVKMLPDGPLGMAIADLLPVGGEGVIGSERLELALLDRHLPASR